VYFRRAKDLKGFARVTLEAGETKTVAFTLRAEQLTYYAADQCAWVVESIEYVALVGPSARASDLLSMPFRIS
jgi:beta-glucosidase